jgi:alpha-1,2-mannosyltransferase
LINFHPFNSFRKPDYRQEFRLVLIGSVRDDQDREYVEQLQILIDNLNIKNEVELKLNLNFKKLKAQLNQAMIGLHTMKNEEFGIGL